MTSLTSRISSDVSGCCDSFCDNGPRFLISNIVSVLIQIAFVITILIIEIGPWSWWYSAFLVLGAAVNLLVLKSSWRNTRKCGDLFGKCHNLIPLSELLFFRGLRMDRL